MFASVEASTGRIVECNRTLVSMLGYGRDEIVGRQVLDIYDPGCRSAAAATFRSFLESGETQAECLQLRRKDGRAIDVSLKVSPERDDEGNVLYGRSVWRDVTDRRRAEDAIKQAQRPLPVYVIRDRLYRSRYSHLGPVYFEAGHFYLRARNPRGARVKLVIHAGSGAIVQRTYLR